MSKRKPARTIKARSASKIRSKAAVSGQPTASEFEAGAGAGTAVRTKRRHRRHRHALHRLAAAHGRPHAVASGFPFDLELSAAVKVKPRKLKVSGFPSRR